MIKKIKIGLIQSKSLGTIQSPASFMGAWSTATSAPVSGYGEGAGTQDAALWWGIYVAKQKVIQTLNWQKKFQVQPLEYFVI